MSIKTKSTGISLDRPSVAVPKISPWFSLCFHAGLLALAVGASLWCVFSAFGFAVNLPPLVIVGALCVILCSVQLHMGRFKLPAVLCQLAVWGLVLRANFTSIQRACFRLVNAVIAAYNSEYSLALAELPLAYTNPTRAARQNTLLAAMIIWLLCEILYLLVVSHKKPFVAFCVTGVFVLVSLGASVVPSLPALGAMLTLWLFLLAAAPALRRDRHSAFSAELTAFRPNALCVIAALAVCVLAFYFIFPESEYTRPQTAQSVKESLLKGELPVDIDIGIGVGGSDNLDLTELAPRSFTGETALKIRRTPTEQSTQSRVDENTTEYLKSYVGSVYTGTGWQPLDKTVKTQITAALGNFTAQTLPASLAEQYPNDNDIHSQYVLEVENVNADRHSLYVPCGLSGEVDGAKFIDDGYLSPSSVFGIDSYELTETGVPYTGVPMTYRFRGLFENEISQRDDKEELRNRLLAEDEVFYAFEWHRRQRYIGIELVKIPEWAKNELPEVDFSLMNAAEQYTEIVYDEYTKLPEETCDFIEEFLMGNGYLEYVPIYNMEAYIKSNRAELENITVPMLSYGGLTAIEGTASYYDIYRIIGMILSDTCDYTLSPQAVPDGRDFVEYFLNESHEGYCVHFATAATAILRYLGIPARYAEGYSVQLDEDGEWTTVHDYNAHAWVEVYYSGTGWLPVEFTPSSARENYANEVAETATPTPTHTPAPTVEPSAPPPEPTAAPTAEVKPTQAPTKSPTEKPTVTVGEQARTTRYDAIPLVMIVAILVVAAAYAQRRARVCLRRRAFSSTDTNTAALRAYAYLLKLHREAARIDKTQEKPPQQLEQLALKARFSSHRITQGELTQIVAAADSLAEKLKAELPLIDKLKCEYILALF